MLTTYNFAFRQRKKKWKVDPGQDSCDSIPEDGNTSLTAMKKFKSEPFDDDGTSSDSDVNEAFMDNVAY